MVKKSKSGFAPKHIAGASTAGAVISVLFCLFLSALLASLINGQTLANETVVTYVPVILYISHTAGGLVAALLSDERKAIAAILAIAGSYFVLAAYNILLGDGSFDGSLFKFLSAVIAYATIFLILLKGKQGRRASKKIRSR